ncbi:Oxoglutarate/iron-dependent dioxygenase [Penicillium occitanis (nom. inval.)]|nr:hypothetical protein PENOC_091020 [Penicillium occitanis (nom. inval.)]PCG95549.1 Oxoglutarate/iron-dependent dioxygenase [Penicillium occitanis (nom. inval.)]
MLATCKTSFDQPKGKKVRLSLHQYSWRRGYEAPGQQQANDPHQGDLLPDQKEATSWLPLHDVGPGKGPNIWPPDLADSEFRESVMKYFSHMKQVGLKVMEVLAVSLGYSPDVLDTPRRALPYKRQFGAGQHTDYGGLTILLLQPGKDGLEVWHAATHQWIELPALEDKFVINLGDLIQR